MSNHVLLIALVFLILAAAFFSSAETALMSINRYRLRHLARSGQRAALRVSKLIERPDRLLSFILLGNTFANIFAASTATFLATEYFGASDAVVMMITFGLTLVVLIFAEIFPKTLAAIYSEKISFLYSWPLIILLQIFSPLTWLVNAIPKFLLQVLGLKVKSKIIDPMTHDEIRSVVGDSDSTLTKERVQMLLGLLDLQHGLVEDIMVPRRDLVGIDVSVSMDLIKTQIANAHYARVPLFQESMDHIVGVLNIRSALRFLQLNPQCSKEALMAVAKPAYYTPETVSLYNQLIQFQKNKIKMAFCVDEFGGVQGLVTIHDILEQIIGDFTTDVADKAREICEERDGSYRVSGTISLRELNRDLGLSLPLDGPSKTLGGLVIEVLESIPAEPFCLVLHGLRLEITRIDEHRIQEIKIFLPSEG